MPIITISRGSKSGGAALAKALQKLLGLKVVSREDAVAAASKRYGVTEEEMVRGLAMPANFFERLTHRKERYLLAMQAAVGELFEEGSGIYHGVAGQFLFQGLCNVFKVRLIAPVEVRIRTAMADLNMSKDEATRYIADADEHRAKWVSQMFSVDINDPDLYDVIVNTEQMSIEGAAEMVGEILGRKKFQPTDECLLEFKDFALEKRVKAELFFNTSFNRDVVDVTVRGGVVGLTGGRAFEAARSELADHVSRVRGVKKVVTDAGEVESICSSLDTDIGLTSLDTKARDVMLSPENYPKVPYWVSIREAIVAISASTVKMTDGYILLPRYALVHDEDELLVGIVSRRELLKGLVPHFMQSRQGAAHIREFMPFAGDTPSEIFINWTSLFTPQALEAANEPVRMIMAEVKGVVNLDDSLSTVISTMLHHRVDLVPVCDAKGRVAGVVLMTNIFDLIAQFIIEHGHVGAGDPGDADRSGGDDA